MSQNKTGSSLKKVDKKVDKKIDRLVKKINKLTEQKNTLVDTSKKSESSTQKGGSNSGSYFYAQAANLPTLNKTTLHGLKNTPMFNSFGNGAFATNQTGLIPTAQYYNENKKHMNEKFTHQLSEAFDTMSTISGRSEVTDQGEYFNNASMRAPHAGQHASSVHNNVINEHLTQFHASKNNAKLNQYKEHFDAGDVPYFSATDSVPTGILENYASGKALMNEMPTVQNAKALAEKHAETAHVSPKDNVLVKKYANIVAPDNNVAKLMAEHYANMTETPKNKTLVEKYVSIAAPTAEKAKALAEHYASFKPMQQQTPQTNMLLEKYVNVVVAKTPNNIVKNMAEHYANVPSKSSNVKNLAEKYASYVATSPAKAKTLAEHFASQHSTDTTQKLVEKFATLACNNTTAAKTLAEHYANTAVNKSSPPAKILAKHYAQVLLNKTGSTKTKLAEHYANLNTPSAKLLAEHYANVMIPHQQSPNAPNIPGAVPYHETFENTMGIIPEHMENFEAVDSHWLSFGKR